MSCAPPCLPPQGTMMFFPGTRGETGPAGPASTVPGPSGATGATGAIAVYVGTYSPSIIYFDNALRRDVVDYAGSYWIAANTAKNASSTWNSPTDSDWDDFGEPFNVVATELRLLTPSNVDVGLNVRPPGYLKSDNFVQFVSGWLSSGAGRLEAYDALIAGQISTGSPRFNIGSVTRTMPGVGYAEFDIPAIIDAAIPVNPTINNVTDNSLIIFGWLQGTNSYIENRFGNVSQKFQIVLQGIGTNTSAGADLFYIQIYYRVRTNGGAWGGWNIIGQDAYMQKIAGTGQSFQNTQPLKITLSGNNDIQFSAGFSKGAGGTVSMDGAKLSVFAFN